jgi:hypothetical protein
MRLIHTAQEDTMADPLDNARRQSPPTPPEQVDDPVRRDLEGRPSGSWPNPDRERAQPGDVLGIEREGETTGIGDTAEEEDERRRQALHDGARKAPERGRR